MRFSRFLKGDLPYSCLAKYVLAEYGLAERGLVKYGLAESCIADSDLAKCGLARCASPIELRGIFSTENYPFP